MDEEKRSILLLLKGHDVEFLYNANNLIAKLHDDWETLSVSHQGSSLVPHVVKWGSRSEIVLKLILFA